MSLLLDQNEREKFAAWLENEAAADDAIAKQAESIGPHGAALSKKLRTEAMAAKIIAAKLRSIEDMSISGQSSE